MINERLLRLRCDVRVVNAEGEQLGIMRVNKALDMARDESLDLLLITDKAEMPVVKIIDYGRSQYEEAKKKKDTKKKVQELKGIQISPRIAEHDLQTHITHATKFLGQGDKVRIVCRFKAREITHAELGKNQLDKMFEALKDVAVMDSPPRLDGKLMTMVLVPKK